MYTVPQIKKVVLGEKITTAENLERCVKEAEHKGVFLVDYLVETGVVSEEVIYQLLAQFLDKPFINLKDRNIRQDILFSIPEQIAQTHEVVAYDKTNDGVLQIAAVDPDDIETFEFIEKKNRTSVNVALTTPSSIGEAMRLYRQGLETELKGLSEETFADDEALPGERLEQLAVDLPVVRLVNSLLEYAVFEGASDIHIEPQEREVSVRYRIDGMLRPVMTLPRNILSGLVARIKILSNLKLDEHRLPQDGRFKIEDKNYNISFRVSTIPVYDGEKIVLRLLDESNQLLHLEDLGFREPDLNKIKRAIERPHGIILVTGPTGSGKTTTLYSILNQLNTQDVNIATVEDPIEYRMPHVNQSQVNPKINFTFASGLRALLRQDPNIIMVGEIRDQETVEIAIQGAMTGHKVLSTLHTNDAPGTLPRLLDMGVVPFLIVSTVNMVMAQRLVRKICRYCIMSYNLDKEAIKKLSDQLEIQSFMKLLHGEGLIEEKVDRVDTLLFFKGKGCKKCGETGYKGRIGIYEILEISEELKQLIANKAHTNDIRQKAREQGMTIMLEDGLIKANNGITTIEEVLRVTRE